MQKLWWVVGIVVVAGLVWWGYSTQEKQISLDHPVKIAALVSLTGPAQQDGQDIQRGIQLAVDDLTAAGVPVEVIFEDDGTDVKKTIGALQKLASIDKPDFIVGLTWSFIADAAGPILESTGMTAFSPANTSEFATPVANLFFGATKNSERKASIAKWLGEHRKKKVAILVDNAPWGISNAEMFKAVAVEVGAEVVFEEKLPPFDTGATIVPTAIAKIKSSGADVLLYTGYYDPTVVLMQKAKELELNIPIVMASTAPFGILANDLVRLTDSDEYYAMITEPQEEFVGKFRAKFGVAPGPYADRAYDGVMLMVEAFAKKGAGQNMAEYLRTTTNYKGYGTTYKFDERGDIVGGEWTIVRLK